MNLHFDVRELAAALRDVEEYLRQYDVPHWAEEIGRCAVLIQRSDYSGGERFLGLFGGMGSLNDLAIIRDGHSLTAETDELKTWLERAYKMATALMSEQQ